VQLFRRSDAFRLSNLRAAPILAAALGGCARALPHVDTFADGAAVAQIGRKDLLSVLKDDAGA
jgi:hypothetical protein